MSEIYDAVIVGGGHNALVAAAYLGRASKRVVVLERLGHVGGAAVSERPWAGVDARLSRYSYLVSLLPRTIIDDLGLQIDLRRRRYSSYTPDPTDPGRGIVIDNGDAAATTASFVRTVGDPREAERFSAFTDRTLPLAAELFPTVTAPLERAAEMRARVADVDLWDALTTRPLGDLLSRELESDIARGIALTDGLIGTFSRADDPSLRQNRCFLYHVIGGGTGDWDVPVGGMGRVSGELDRAARADGAEVRTGPRSPRSRPTVRSPSTPERASTAASSSAASAPRCCAACSAPTRATSPRAHSSRSTCCCAVCRASATPPSRRKRRSPAPSTSTRR